MAKVPQTITITLLCADSGTYRARLTGWTVGDTGSFGSCWTLGIEELCPRDSSAATVLGSLVAALAERVGRAYVPE